MQTPSWRVTGVDFNPGPYRDGARLSRRDAGIDNATFLEADLATLAEDRQADAIPEADFVSAHGLWSWVPATCARRALSACCAQKCAPAASCI